MLEKSNGELKGVRPFGDTLRKLGGSPKGFFVTRMTLSLGIIYQLRFSQGTFSFLFLISLTCLAVFLFIFYLKQ